MPSFLLKKILDDLSSPASNPIYLLLFFCAGLAKTMTFGQYIYVARKISIQLKSLLSAEIYVKMLSLCQFYKSSVDEGVMINLMAVDTAQASNFF